MQIIYIASSIIPSRYANSIQVMKMCQAFAEAGHRITLCVPRWSGTSQKQDEIFQYYGIKRNFEIVMLRTPGLSHWRIVPVRLGQLLYSLRAVGFVKRRKPDLIYGRSFLACCLAALLNLPVVFESHVAIKSDSLRGKLLRYLLESKRMRRLVVISTALRNYYVEQMKVPDTYIVIAPDAADIPPEIMDQPDNGKNASLDVGYIGHLYPGKGMELISQLVGKCPWARFHIVGGAENDIRLWEDRLKEYSNIKFYGFVNPSDTEQYRQRCDVLLAPYQKKVIPSRTNGTDLAPWMSPLKLFEYMASGKAILCSKLDVLEEILTDRETAVFCDPDNVDEWVANLDDLRRNAPYREQLGVNARSVFLSQYTWQARVQNIVNALS